MDDPIAETMERFDALIVRYRSLIRKLCWRHARGNAARCTELVQECYIVMWRRLSSLSRDRHPLQELSWVVWCCRSAISHHYERRHLWWLPLDEENGPIYDDDTARDDRARIEELAAGLSPRERLYLQLLLDGYGTDEIARELGIKPESVYSLRKRVIEKMKQNANNPQI